MSLRNLASVVTAVLFTLATACGSSEEDVTSGDAALSGGDPTGSGATPAAPPPCRPFLLEVGALGTTSLAIERACLPGQPADVKLRYKSPDLDLTYTSKGPNKDRLDKKLLGMATDGVKAETFTFLAKTVTPAVLALLNTPEPERTAARARIFEGLEQHILALP